MSASFTSSVVVLEESPCPRGSPRTNFQVLGLVLVLEAQVLVLVLEPQVLVLVFVFGSSSPQKSSRTA